MHGGQGATSTITPLAFRAGHYLYRVHNDQRPTDTTDCTVVCAFKPKLQCVAPSETLLAVRIVYLALAAERSPCSLHLSVPYAQLRQLIRRRLTCWHDHHCGRDAGCSCAAKPLMDRTLSTLSACSLKSDKIRAALSQRNVLCERTASCTSVSDKFCVKDTNAFCHKAVAPMKQLIANS